MKNIITVLGEISSDELGFCQCHEHLMLRKGKSFEINPALCIDDLAKSTAEAIRFKNHGGRTIIEAQPCGCDRMEHELSCISSSAGINIIASTGFHKLDFYYDNHWIHSISEKELSDLFIEELVNGMYIHSETQFPTQQCSSLAGIIKTAYDKEELSDRYKTLFRAAMNAARETQRIISVHIEQGTNPLTLLNYMISYGIEPHNLIFCHMDRACPDLEIHKAVLSKGVYLEYDTIGRFKYHDDAHEISIIKTMIDAGYEDQLLFSLDTTRDRLKTYNPDAVGLDYILTTFIPMMKAANITSQQIRKMSNLNCISLFT